MSRAFNKTNTTHHSRKAIFIGNSQLLLGGAGRERARFDRVYQAGADMRPLSGCGLRVVDFAKVVHLSNVDSRL
jgi:hypothetical protein